MWWRSGADIGNGTVGLFVWREDAKVEVFMRALGPRLSSLQSTLVQ